MPKIDDYELEILSAFEKGELKSVATQDELAELKAAASKQARGAATKRRTSLAS